MCDTTWFSHKSVFTDHERLLSCPRLARTTDSQKYFSAFIVIVAIHLPCRAPEWKVFLTIRSCIKLLLWYTLKLLVCLSLLQITRSQSPCNYLFNSKATANNFFCHSQHWKILTHTSLTFVTLCLNTVCLGCSDKNISDSYG